MASRLERLQEKSAEVKPSKPSNSNKNVSRDAANKQLKADEWEANKYAFLGMRVNSARSRGLGCACFEGFSDCVAAHGRTPNFFRVY
eukprot:47578-Pyramimonas_sp.AAC.1